MKIDPRAMRMDAQTYRDLEIFEATTGASVYDICNLTRTGGGAKLLRARMRKPWATLDKIRAVQDSLTFIIEHRDALDRLAQELLSRETLDSVQIRRIVAGLPLDEDGPSPRTEPEAGKPADKEPVLKPILPPITGSNPATA